MALELIGQSWEQTIAYYLERTTPVNGSWLQAIADALANLPTPTTNGTIQYIATDYTDLLTVTGSTAGDFAYVENSQGTQWLPGTMGGNYYGSGLYYYTGSSWISNLPAIQNQLQLNNDRLVFTGGTGLNSIVGINDGSNLSSGNYGYSIGQNNDASGTFSHAQGFGNISVGNYSTLIGRNNVSNGSTQFTYMYGDSNTGGTNTYTFGETNNNIGQFGITVGINNVTSGVYGVVMGRDSIVESVNGVAIGRQNTVTSSGSYSLAVGYLNDVSGISSSALGQNNTVSGNYSSAVGRNNIGNGQNSLTVGFTNTSSGDNSIALGYLNQSTGAQSFSTNNTNTASGTNSFVINQLNTASGFNSFVGGFGSTGSGLGSFIHSYNSLVSSNYSSILGGIDNNVNGHKSVVIGGSGNTVSGDNSSIIGGNGLTLTDDNTVLVPKLVSDTLCETGTQFKAPTNTGGIITSNTFDFDCNVGMSQVLDLQAATSASTLTFSNPMEGNTYMLIVIQGSGLYNLVLPTGYWLNDTAPFLFTTLANDERAMITATYLGSTWYFAVKELTLV